MRIRRRAVAEVAVLVVVWVALWGQLSVANAAAGLLVALGVRIVSPLRTPDRSASYLRPVAALRFVAVFAWMLVRSSLQVAREVLRPTPGRRGGVLAVGVQGLSDRLVSLVANTYSLTPGSITIAVHHDPPVIYVHLLHLEDVERTRAELLALRRLAVQAFGSPEAIRELTRSAAP